VKKIILFLTAAVILNAAGAWKTDIAGDNQTAVFYNDDGENAIKNKKMKIFAMAGPGNWMEKKFDLSQLPPEWKNNVGGASIRIYMQLADQSKAVKKRPRENGFTEQMIIQINGKNKIYSTGDPLWPTAKKWVDIPISTEELQGDELVIRIGKIKSDTNDDYVYVGMDTSADPGNSKISIDSGKNFRLQNRHLPEFKGEFMLRLVLYRAVQEFSADLTVKPEAVSAFKLENGCKTADKALVFDGVNSRAILKNSKTFNVTEKGLTIAGVMRMDYNGPDSPKKDHNMLIAFKPGAWFLGRTGNQINLSFSTDGKSWMYALFGSEFPDLGEWFHIAAVFERVNQSAESLIGYNLTLYLNGEPAGQKMFYHLDPSATDEPVIIGNGSIENYGFKGSISALDIFQRSLNAGEIAELIKKANRISKLPPGFVELIPELDRQLTAAAKNAPTPLARFLVNMVTRAAATGYDQKAILAAMPKMKKLFTAADSPEKLAAKWNSESPLFNICASSNALLFTAPGKSSGNSPVLGLYDLHSQRDIFDNRATSWAVTANGRKIHDRSTGVNYRMTPVKKNRNGGTFQVIWEKAGDFECISNYTFSGSRLEQSFEVKNLNKNLLISEVDFPRYFFTKLPGKKDQLVFPRFNGLLRDNPASGYGESGLYPSCHASMQFIGYFDESANGIYAAFEAVDAGVKTLSVSGKNNTLEYKWNSPVAQPFTGQGGNHYKSAGNAVVETYRGNWFEAGQLYKKFVEAKAPWAVRELPRKDTPEWYRDNCLWLASSSDHVPSMLYLRKYFDIPYASWHCQWFNVDKGTLPDWSIRQQDKEPIAKLLKNGIYVHPYCNARIYGYTNGRYYMDRTKSKEFLENSVVRPDGQRYFEDYDGAYGVMCPGTEFWQDRLLQMARAVADNGMNGCYYDQLPCSSPRVCYAKNHGHAPGDPASWAPGYWKMLKELRRRHPQLGLDGEDNSEVYVNTLDGFMTWRSSGVGHVPLFQSIYGGGRAQFTARGFDAFGGKSGSYEATFAKLGEQFVYSEQIGWLHIFDIRWGTPRRTYAKKLAHLRRAMLGYLNESDMLAPLKFAEKIPQMSVVWGCVGETITSDKVLSCAWKRLRDGRIAVLFTNTSEEKITVKPATRYPGYDKLAVCSEGKDVRYITLASGSALPAVELAPHSTEIWLLGKTFDRAEAEKIAAVTKKVASFTDAGESIHYQAPQFKVSKKLTADPGKWFTAEDSSWLLYAFKERHPSLGFNNRSRQATEAEKGNWILARAGAVISYGEVDFGNKAPKYLEMQIAISPENAGGKISMDDVSGQSEPNKTLAEITTAPTGGFFKWKTVRVPIKPVTGKRTIVFHVTGKDCNIRAWRVIK